MTKHQQHPLIVANEAFGPGVHHKRIPVTIDLNGGNVDLHAHLVVGERPGPTLTVTSTLHGVEWFSIEMLRRLRDRLDPATMSGALILLPVGNPPALGAMTRSTPDDSDGADMNRVFPGNNTWIAEQMARVIVDEILPVTSAIIDHHLGLWGNAFGYVVYGKDVEDPAVIAESKAMAEAFNLPMVSAANLVSVSPGSRSLVGYATTALGIPGCLCEYGGAGFGTEIEERWIETAVEGMLNAMRTIGILNEAATPGRAYLNFEVYTRVNPRYGGLLYPTFGGDQLGREVHEGEVLGQVVSPYTFEVLEELVAPHSGYLAWMARWCPVRPGDWAFGVVPKNHPHTHTVDPSTI